MTYKPQAPEWWKKQRQLEEDQATQRTRVEAEAKQERKAKLISALRATGKALMIILALIVVSIAGLFTIVSATGATSRRRRR